MSVINELEIEESAKYLVDLIIRNDENEAVICEAVSALAQIGRLDDIDKEAVLEKITDPNLLAVIQEKLVKV